MKTQKKHNFRYPVKDPKRKGLFSNHPFLDMMLDSGTISKDFKNPSLFGTSVDTASSKSLPSVRIS